MGKGNAARPRSRGGSTTEDRTARGRVSVCETWCALTRAPPHRCPSASWSRRPAARSMRRGSADIEHPEARERHARGAVPPPHPREERTRHQPRRARHRRRRERRRRRRNERRNTRCVSTTTCERMWERALAGVPRLRLRRARALRGSAPGAPNVFVAHQEEGIEVVHLHSGRTVCDRCSWTRVVRPASRRARGRASRDGRDDGSRGRRRSIRHRRRRRHAPGVLGARHERRRAP